MTNSYEILTKALNLAKKEPGLSEKARKDIEIALGLAELNAEKEETVINALLREVDAHLDYEDDKDMLNAAEDVKELFA